VLLDEGLVPAERTLYELLNVDQARHIDEIMEVSGLTSSEVLATLFDLELKGVVRQLPGKQFLKVLVWSSPGQQVGWYGAPFRRRRSFLVEIGFREERGT